jgi:predicted house-cleaning noncanonical NTP pyrophosphatase (MazG superfamily)
MSVKTIRIFINKLVRDKVVGKLEEEKITCVVHKMNIGEYLYFLKKKSLEEAKEIVRTKRKQELLEELADFFDVFEKIMKEYNISMLRIVEESKKLKEILGGLSKKLFLVDIKDDSSLDLKTKSLYEKVSKRKEDRENGSYFIIQKLIFDNQVKQFESYNCKIETIEEKRFLYELKRMLVDVTRDILKTNNKNELINVLSKCFIVFNEILNEYNIPISKLIELSNMKIIENGSFEKKYLLKTIDLPQNHEKLKFYENYSKIEVVE